MYLSFWAGFAVQNAANPAQNEQLLALDGPAEALLDDGGGDVAA